MKVGLERVGAVVGTLLLAFALLLVNSPVRAASYVATDASSTTSPVLLSLVPATLGRRCRLVAPCFT